jgi:excisionase family DNA binding protein
MTNRNDQGAPPASQLPRALTAADLAGALKVSVRTIRRMIAAGDVRVIRIGRSVRIPADEVGRLLKPR